MNIEFLIVLLIVSKSVDWIFQTSWQATNKSKNIYALFLHSFIYASVTSALSALVLNLELFYYIITSTIIFFILFISHMVIDDRKLVKKILSLKGLSNDEIESDKFWWLLIEVDQRLHEIVILLIALII